MNTHARVPYLVPGWETCLLSTNPPPSKQELSWTAEMISSPTSRMYLKLQINKKKKKNKKEEKTVYFPFFLFVSLTGLRYLFVFFDFFFFLFWSHLLHKH